MSLAATDILKRLVCEPENRLGKNGATEIKKHPFFDGFDWESVKSK